MKVMPRTARRIACAILTLTTALPSLAGVFSVTPVRLYLTPRDRAVALTVTNEGDSEVVLQADINSWAQKSDGTDELVLTEDLILAPPILKLAPKARQVVRLALLKPADPARQLTYRLVVREVPEAAQLPPGVQVPLALALSMPVFVTPPAAKRQVDCSTSRGDAQTVALSCRNTGTAYAQVREAVIKRGDQVLARFEGGNYILPGAVKTVALKGEQPITAGEAQLAVTFDDGQSITQALTLP